MNAEDSSGRDLQPLARRVAFVTGGGGGLNEAAVQRFAEAGAIVLPADVRSSEAEGIFATLRDQHREAISPLLDVAEVSSAEKAMNRTLEREMVEPCHTQRSS